MNSNYDAILKENREPHAMSVRIHARSIPHTVTVTVAIFFVAWGGVASAAGIYARFKADNKAVMGRMMTGMAIKPSGDVDRDFVDMMIPHHQGAIDMAEAELRYGANEQLRRIAQEIIVDQQQEITAMRLTLGEPLPPSKPSPTQPARPSPLAHP
jgi:hypothetical protein